MAERQDLDSSIYDDSLDPNFHDDIELIVLEVKTAFDYTIPSFLLYKNKTMKKAHRLIKRMVPSRKTIPSCCRRTLNHTHNFSYNLLALVLFPIHFYCVIMWARSSYHTSTAWYRGCAVGVACEIHIEQAPGVPFAIVALWLLLYTLSWPESMPCFVQTERGVGIACALTTPYSRLFSRTMHTMTITLSNSGLSINTISLNPACYFRWKSQYSRNHLKKQQLVKKRVLRKEPYNDRKSIVTQHQHESFTGLIVDGLGEGRNKKIGGISVLPCISRAR